MLNISFIFSRVKFFVSFISQKVLTVGLVIKHFLPYKCIIFKF